MDGRYSQDGERYTPPSSSSSARQSFNRFKDSVPGRVSSLRGQLQSLPGTIQGIPDKLQSIPDRLQTLPDKLQTAQGRAQEQFAKIPDRFPNRPASRSVSSSEPASPISPSTAPMMMKAPERDDPAYDPTLAALAGKILYRSGYDPESGGPLLILCAANFPDGKQVDYNKLLPYVLSIIPSDDELGPEGEGGGYSVVFFSGGGGMPGTGNGGGGGGITQGNRPSWAWTLQAYHLLGRAVRKRIRKLWVVHEKAWVRIIFEMMAGVVSVKFRKKKLKLTGLSPTLVNTISDLAMHLDIKKLHIPPAVYFHDRKLSQTINIPSPPPPIFGCPPFHNASNPPRIGENMPLPQVLVDTYRYIHSRCLHVEGIFRVPPNSVLLDVLREAVDRGQYLKLDEWGPHTCAALIKLYYRSLPEPIFSTEYYEILMSFSPAMGDAEDGDRLEEEYIFPKIKYLLEGEKGLPKSSRVLLLKHLLPLLALVAQNAEVNKMTPKNLAVCIAASLIRSDDMMADAKASSGVRKFLEVAIERIEELSPQLPNRPSVEHGRNSSSSSVVDFGINLPTSTTSLPPYTPGKQTQRKKVPGTETKDSDRGVHLSRKPVGGSTRSSMDGQTLVDSEGISSLPLQPPLQPQPVLTPPPVVYRRGSTPSGPNNAASAATLPPSQSSNPVPQGGIVLRRKASLQALVGGGDEGTLSKGPSSYSSSSNLSPHNTPNPSPLTRSLSVSSSIPPRTVRRAISSSFLPSATSFSPSPSSSVAAIANSLNRAQFNPSQNVSILSSQRDSISPTAVPMVRAKTELSVGSRSRSGTLISLRGNESRRGSVVERNAPVVASGVVEELRALYEERAKSVEVLVRAGTRGSVKGRWKEHQP